MKTALTATFLLVVLVLAVPTNIPLQAADQKGETEGCYAWACREESDCEDGKFDFLYLRPGEGTWWPRYQCVGQNWLCHHSDYIDGADVYSWVEGVGMLAGTRPYEDILPDFRGEDLISIQEWMLETGKFAYITFVDYESDPSGIERYPGIYYGEEGYVSPLCTKRDLVLTTNPRPETNCLWSYQQVYFFWCVSGKF